MRALPLTILAVVCSACFSLAQSEDVPKELQALRNSYANAQRRAIHPLQKHYRSGLETLLTKLTRAGDLEGAMTVRKEIESLPATEAILPGSAVGPATRPKTNEELVKFLKGTSWELAIEPDIIPAKKPPVMKFLDNKTVQMDWGEKVSWTPVSTRTLRINHRDWTRSIAFAQDFRSFELWVLHDKRFVHGHLVPSR